MNLSALQRYCLDKMDIDVYLSKENVLQESALKTSASAENATQGSQKIITPPLVDQSDVAASKSLEGGSESSKLLDKLLEQAEKNVNAEKTTSATESLTDTRARGHQDSEVENSQDASNDAPQFNLLVQRCDQFLLIDSLPLGETVGVEYRRFLQDFLTACRLKPIAEPEQFQWPFLDNPLVEKDEQAARESLQYWLEQRSDKQQALLFGEDAKKYLSATVDSALEFHAFDALFETPELKAKLWQKIQELLELSS